MNTAFSTFVSTYVKTSTPRTPLGIFANCIFAVTLWLCAHHAEKEIVEIWHEKFNEGTHA